ncbi:MAG: TrmH family RNA methyltransferase [Gemmatimonadales bacterium]
MGHPLHTTIRDLRLRRGRERRGLCLAEGVRLVEEAVSAGVEIRSVLVSPALETTDRGRALRASLSKRAAVTEATDAELTDLAATEHPQGVLAVIAPRTWTLDDIPSSAATVVVILDAVQDPGNVGTIARTAWALGASGIVTLPGTAEITNPKALRATMGALFRIPVVAAAPEAAAAWATRRAINVVTTSADGTPLDQATLRKPLAFVLGNEGQGAQSALARAAATRVAIPLAAGAESLNVAVAAGILLYGVLRGR